MTSRKLFRAEKLFELGAGVGPVLGLDTASATASLAIVSHGKVLAQVTRSAASHGAELPAAVAEIFAQAALTLKDLQGIAVGIGPGSFTGLRVGIAYAKGLVLALGCALIGIPTFDCLALAAFEQSVGARGNLDLPDLRCAQGRGLRKSLSRKGGSAGQNFATLGNKVTEPFPRAFGRSYTDRRFESEGSIVVTQRARNTIHRFGRSGA